MLLRNSGCRYVGSRVLYPFGVLIGAKDGDLAVGSSERLHALKGLDSIVEPRGHAMDREMR